MPINELLFLPEPRIITGENLHYFLAQSPEVENMPIANELDLEEYKPLLKGVHDKARKVKAFEPDTEIAVSRASYYDHRARKTRFTRISIGDFSTVPFNYQRILQKGDLPLIESYTRPVDSLPFARDYLPLVVGYQNRVMRGIFVVCPRVQLLALTTNQTPFFDSSAEAIDHLDKVDATNAAEGMGIARDLNIRLYSSFDMRHFTAFSS